MHPCPTGLCCDLCSRFLHRALLSGLAGLATWGLCLAAAAQPAPVGPADAGGRLSEAVLVDMEAFSRAPRIVAAAEGRVLLGPGDRAYASGPGPLPMPPASPRWRVLRPAVVLKDPATGAVLGHEAAAIGWARLLEAERHHRLTGADGQPRLERVAARIEIVQAHEEVRVGDRLLAESPEAAPPPGPAAPPPPAGTLSGQVVAVSGSARSLATPGEVVVINRGRAHGLAPGHLLTVLGGSRQLSEPDDGGHRPLHLPDEQQGLIEVLRSFEQLSHARVLRSRDAVAIGDRFSRH